MLSPIPPHRRLEQIFLDDGLSAYRCRDSGGIYLPAESYWRWLHGQPARLPHLPPPPDTTPPVEQSPSPRCCPETGTLMLRFKVGHGFTFSLDRSVTGGIWLDAGEWDALKSRNFHHQLHLVFTAPWQAAARREEAQKVEQDLLRSRMGADLMARLEEVKTALAEHPHRNAALAYLRQI